MMIMKNQDPEWAKVVAIQTLMRDLEAQAVAAYMTSPDQYLTIQDALGQTLDYLTSFVGAARCTSDDNCPPGWSCVDGVCRAYVKPGR